MRKSLLSGLLVFIFIFSSVAASASAPVKRKKKKTAFTQGQSMLQLGVGAVSLLQPQTDTLLYFGTVKRNALLPIQLRYEYAVTGNIGIGAMLGYSSSKVTYTDNTDPENINGFKYSYILAGARASFHLKTKSPKFDPYFAGFAGLNLTTISPFGPSNPLEVQKKVFLWSAHVGANYFFNDHIGAFVEVGYGVSVVNAGVSLKFAK